MIALTFSVSFFQNRTLLVIVVRLCGTLRPLHQIFPSLKGTRFSALFSSGSSGTPLISYPFSDAEIYNRRRFGWCRSMGVACFFLPNGWLHRSFCLFSRMLFCWHCLLLCPRMLVILSPFSEDVHFFLRFCFFAFFSPIFSCVRNLLKLSPLILLTHFLQTSIVKCPTPMMPLTPSWESPVQLGSRWMRNWHVTQTPILVLALLVFFAGGAFFGHSCREERKDHQMDGGRSRLSYAELSGHF